MPAQRNLPNPSTTDADTNEASIDRQRVDLLYAGMPLAILAVAINALVLSWLLLDRVPTPRIAAWLGATLLISLFRWFLHRRLGASTTPIGARTRLRWAVVGVLLSGLSWSLAGLLLYPVDDVAGQGILAVIIAGIASGAVHTLAVFLHLARAFLGLALAPFIVQAFISGGEIGGSLALLGTLYLTLMLIIAARYHRTLVDSLRMRCAHEQAEATAAHQAFYDTLTGLPNRRLLLDRLARQIRRNERTGSSGAVLLMDVDRFKAINDSLGHGVGDRVLRIIAERLSRCIGGDETAARIGGDEFVLVLPELPADPRAGAHRARQIADRVATRLSMPCRPDGDDVHMTVSIGIALFPGDSAEPDELLRAASTAMNRAKEAGRDGVRFYLPEMQAAAVARMAMERALRRALSEGELALYLQPQCDGTGTIVAAEALLRWPRGDGVVAPPATFVPLAEDCGLIHALGDWVFDEALKMIQHLRRRPECPLGRIAVNVSPRQFRRPDFVAALTRRIAEHGVAPGALELELTEGTVVADFADTARKMNALRRLGVHFSIDDFGTGWSSLSYLKRLPLDALKIDRSFVRDLAHDESDAAIVEAIIAMAHRLGLLVIAEGVDQPSVQALLAARGCDRYQGNLLYAPMPFDRFCDRLPGQPAPFREAE